MACNFKFLNSVLNLILAILQSMDVGCGIGWSMPASKYLMAEHPKRVIEGSELEFVPGFSQTVISWVFSIQALILAGICLFFGPYMHNFSSRTILIFFGFFKILYYGMIIFLDTTVTIQDLILYSNIIFIFLSHHTEKNCVFT